MDGMVKLRSYEEAKMKIILLECTDIVTASGVDVSDGESGGVLDSNWDVNG